MITASNAFGYKDKILLGAKRIMDWAFFIAFLSTLGVSTMVTGAYEAVYMLGTPDALYTSFEQPC